jgi:hypothetical protein
MSLQARPFEHQCFMVENMATGTAAAYVLRFPDEALADLSERHRRLGTFSPMSRMLTSEADRIRVIAADYEGNRITLERLLSCVGPYLATDEDAEILRTSTQEAARELRRFSAFIDDVSRLMDLDRHQAEERIVQVFNRHAEISRLIAGLRELPVEKYRENAQGICRGIMFEAVINRLREGRRDFSGIDDPYGDEHLELRTEASGFTLVSNLVHHSRIRLRFGLAGPRRDGEPADAPERRSRTQ